MRPARRFRFEVVTERADGRRLVVSRHHVRGAAERRLIQLPLSPGDSVEILDDGLAVRRSRIPRADGFPPIPY